MQAQSVPTTTQLDGTIAELMADMCILPPFESLAPLPSPNYRIQCVSYKQEILICGGNSKRDCYSYHSLRNQYKYICSYPDDVKLNGHCVIKRINSSNPNGITLLSFGGPDNKKKHTLVMRYTSVWDDVDEVKRENVSTKPCNQWIPFTNNENKPITIGRDEDDYQGVRAVIGGSGSHLLFITYPVNNLDIIDLTTFQVVKRSTLPIRIVLGYHCFVSKKQKELPITKLNASADMYELMLFSKDTGLLLMYNEKRNTIKFEDVRVCTSIRQLSCYGYACVDDTILFFGGNIDSGFDISDNIHRYSMEANKWLHLEQALPIPLDNCIGIVDEDKSYIHIIGGYSGQRMLTTHMKVKVEDLMKEETEKEKEWFIEEEEIRWIEEIKIDLKKIKKNSGKLLKVKLKFFFAYLFCDIEILFFKKKKKKKEKERNSNNN
ncbi:hypothetical protein RFI_18385 [Reticulomyxa filosa]|uniref:Kelch motif family protein n=1 Tax=Reticulomyxa filosa TaxID=46433 RepID=X6MYI9_RETFI|nr:hypothetical protein RFI_18385 [Reticulomyxa filosa]|eukprot:ETO18861.1 hypothetical protein RFI_18385 [Reticulomyxa filosa]